MSSLPAVSFQVSSPQAPAGWRRACSAKSGVLRAPSRGTDGRGARGCARSRVAVNGPVLRAGPERSEGALLAGFKGRSLQLS